LRLRIGVALATVYVVWGSTYLAIDVAIGTLPPFLMSGLRFALAGGLLLAWTARGTGLPTPRQAFGAAVVGVALLGIGTGGIAWAEQRIPTGTAALVIATVPLWIALLEWAVEGRRPSAREAVGLATGLLGVGVLVGPSSTSDLAGIGIVLAGAISWAAGSVYARRAPMPLAPLQSAGVQMLGAAAALTVAGLALGETGHVHLARVSPGSLAAVAYLVVFGSLVGYTAYSWLLRAAPLSLVSTYAYVNPAVAVLLGWEFRSEPLGARTALAALTILVSVVLTVTGIRPRARRPQAASYDAGLRVAAAHGRAGLSGW
jgi:drug/metabolite transporter (DMT)-like permease